MKKAVPSIVEIKNYLDNHPKAILAGLEHLDERYVKAVGYATKAKSRGRPRMILLGDIVSDDEDAAGEAASHVVRIANARDGEGFVAVTPEQRKRFWLDRARTAAISKHTNAFKINEDVVIPLGRLGDYTDGIERINIEFSIASKLKLVRRLQEFFAGEMPLWGDDDTLEKIGRDELVGDRPAQALELLGRVAQRWSYILANLDQLAGSVRTDLEGLGVDPVALGNDAAENLFSRVQLHNLRISWKRELRDPLRQIFTGRDFEPVMTGVEKIHAEVLRGRVFVALHMHAGDGNVHTNIPVNSDNYEMLREANAAVARIMQFARDLGGVISGEHGIGLTKMEYLTPEELAPFAEYKKRVDPEGRFNRGKLLAGADLTRAYTPFVRPHRPRIADPGAERDRRHRRHVQGLPALRQVQAGVHHPRAARQPALQPAQQDPRHLAAHRGLPLRGADPARGLDPPLRRIRRRGRPLHGVPQVRVAVPGRHRLRRRLDRHEEPAVARCASAGPASARGPRCSSSTPPIRPRSSSSRR